LENLYSFIYIFLFCAVRQCKHNEKHRQAVMCSVSRFTTKQIINQRLI
jgi:hypothetical protein